MSDIDRDYLVVLDVKKGRITSPCLNFVNSDIGTSNIYLQLVSRMTMSNKTPLENPEMYIVMAVILKAKTTPKVVLGKLINKEESIFEFNLPPDCTNLGGVHDIEFLVEIKEEDELKCVTSSPTRFVVGESILTEINEEIEEDENFPILKEMIDEVVSMKSDLALKSEIPDKTSDLENDSQFITADDIHKHDNKEVLDNITQQDIDNWNKEYEMPLASQDTLGGVKVGEGLITSEDGTLSVDNKDVNWSDINGKPTKLSEFKNDAGFLTRRDLPYINPSSAKVYFNDNGDLVVTINGTTKVIATRES